MTVVVSVIVTVLRLLRALRCKMNFHETRPVHRNGYVNYACLWCPYKVWNDDAETS